MLKGNTYLCSAKYKNQKRKKRNKIKNNYKLKMH